MANRLSQEKANAIASAYTTNGLKKVEALLSVGYSINYAKNGGLKLFDNHSVKQSIAKIEALTVTKTARTIESLDLMQQAAYDLAMRLNQPSAAVSAGTAIARLYGMDKDAGIKPAPDVVIDDSARETVKEITRQYTLRLAQ